MHLFISEEGTESLEKTHNLPNKLTLVGGATMWLLTCIQTQLEIEQKFQKQTEPFSEIHQIRPVKRVSTKTRKEFKDLGLQTKDQQQGICHFFTQPQFEV